MMVVNPDGEIGLLGSHDRSLAGHRHVQRQTDLDIQNGIFRKIVIGPKQNPGAADVDCFAELPMRHPALAETKGNMKRESLRSCYESCLIVCHSLFANLLHTECTIYPNCILINGTLVESPLLLSAMNHCPKTGQSRICFITTRLCKFPPSLSGTPGCNSRERRRPRRRRLQDPCGRSPKTLQFGHTLVISKGLPARRRRSQARTHMNREASRKDIFIAASKSHLRLIVGVGFEGEAGKLHAAGDAHLAENARQMILHGAFAYG